MDASGSSSHTRTHVVIVGGGPTGLVAACELARRGITCRVLEKATEFFAGSRGKGVMPRTLELFDDLGIMDAILEHGEPNPPMRLFNRGTSTGTLRFRGGDPTPDLPYPTMMLVAQWRTEAILRELLGSLGAEVELGRELVGLTQDATGVVAAIRDVDSGSIEEAEFDYAIGADGGRSTMRKLLDLRFEGVSSDEQTFLIGDVEIDGLEGGYRYAWANTENHQFAQATPMKGSNVWQFAVNVFPDGTGAVPEPSVPIFQRLFNERTGRTDVVLRDPVWLSEFTYHSRMVDHYRRGRAFIAGDAAHIHSPVAGEGLNAGVQDAYNLAWKLALVVRGRAHDSLLDTYEEERLPIARDVLSSSSTAHMALFSTKPLTTLLRKYVVLPGLRIPAVSRAVMTRVSALGVGYRRSSLSENHGRGGRVLAGDRAPDGRLADASSGEEVRIFELLHSPAFNVVLFGVPDAALTDSLSDEFGDDVAVHSIARRAAAVATGQSTLIDARGRTSRRYGVRRPTAFVIRPDGYVSYRGPTELSAIRRHLARFLQSGAAPGSAPPHDAAPDRDETLPR